MYEALALLNELTDGDIDWIMDAGVEKQIIANTSVIREGADPDALYIVLEGLLGVSVAAVADRQLATLGPGELVGEISFLEGRPASASVDAVENSLLMILHRASLEVKLHEDSAFAARLYRSFALLASKRLRERVEGLGRALRDRPAAEPSAEGVAGEILKLATDFKGLIQEADKAALKHDGMVPDPLRQKTLTMFKAFDKRLNDLIGDASAESMDTREQLGALLQREVLPYLLLTRTAERFYSKPRGYAGDFLTIQMIYQNRPGGTGRSGPLLDECFLDAPPARAVRNRRGLLVEEINRVIAAKGKETTRITSLACGPAAEVFDAFEQVGDPDRLRATLIDIDLQALAFVGDILEKNRKLQSQVRLENGNLLYLATGRQRLDLKEQDLVYSIGLIDYFNDRFVIRLLNYVHGLLRSGGKVILGNFHSKNPSKAYMDYILDWRLIHRTEDDMNRLFEQSSFGKPCTDIRFEEEGVNLFAMCVRD